MNDEACYCAMYVMSEVILFHMNAQLVIYWFLYNKLLIFQVRN